MCNVAKLREWLRRTYIGPIAVAILLHWSLYGVVEAVESPLSALATGIVNAVLPVMTFRYNWAVTAGFGAWAVVVGALGLLFAQWLCRRTE